MRPSGSVDSVSVRSSLASFAILTSFALVLGCSGDDSGSGDAGPAICPTGAPDVGTPCPEDVGICPYEGLNRNCPPYVGECRCVQGGWVCAVPECTACNETCAADCCNLDDVCRVSADGLHQECGREGNRSAAMFEPCGHQSDCAGQMPVCSPICGALCCTFTCDGQDECAPGTCSNGVCTPP